MRPHRPIFFATATLFAFGLASVTEAQPDKKGGKGGKGSSETVDQFIGKLMAFDKDNDGKLTKDELTDRRLHALFDRADAKKTGYVTRAELETLFAREALPAGGDFKGDFKGKKGPFDGKKKGPP
jgi:hypothetical protein